MTFKIEHRMEWPLGESWTKSKLEPEDIVLVDVSAQWDPSDDWVSDATFSIGLPMLSADKLSVALEQVKAQLHGMLDSALTEAIDNAKMERKAV